MPSRPEKIVSGGQTGVDRAALDWALANSVACGGYVPHGRWAEDGPIADRYTGLIETASDEPAERTEMNVVGSDGTLIVAPGKLFGGTMLTWRLARKHRKPVLVAELYRYSIENCAEKTRAWVSAGNIRVLNVAGPRASKRPEIYGRTLELLDLAFGGK